MLFHNISAGILRWIVKQPNVKEESLTDRLLYEVSEGSDRFIYKSFSRNWKNRPASRTCTAK